MRKTAIFIIVVMMFVMVTGCGDSGTNPGTPSVDNSDLLSYNAKKMITDGSTILDSVSASYTALTGTDTAIFTKVIADHMLFPFNNENTDKDFSQRMKDQFWGENNVINAVNLFTDYASVSKTSTSYSLKLQNSKSTKSLLPIDPGSVINGIKNKAKQFIKDKAKDIVSSIPFVGGLVGSLFGGKSKEQRNQEKMMAQLSKIGKTLNQFRNETRQNFAKINEKVDQVLGNLSTLQGDVNFLHGDLQGTIVNSEIQDIKNNFDGFILNVKTAATVQDASNAAYTYFINSSDYWQDLLKFVDCSSNVQKWAIEHPSESGYADWMHLEPTVNTNIQEIKIYVTSSVSTNMVFGYMTPKKCTTISIGNLDFLSTMMINRLAMNSMLYSGEVLKNNNAVLALQFLSLLETAGYKQGLINAINVMKTKKENIKSMVWNNFVDAFNPALGLTSNDINYFYVMLGGHSVNGFQYAKFEGGDPTLCLNFHKFIEEHFKNALLETYRISFIARLIALEVTLKSYL